MKFGIPLLLLLAFFLWPASPARAVCSSPSGTAGDIFFNSDYHYLEYCDNTNWIGVAPSAGTVPPVVTFLTSGTSWSVPSDWNSSDNTIEVIGGGGGGGNSDAADAHSGGGGGGGYSKSVNVTLTPSTSVNYAIGAGGGMQAAGGDTWFCNSTSNCASIAGTAVVAGAKGGGAGGSGTAGAGGASASGVATGTGNVKNSGGGGGTSTDWGGGGGGGGAGGGGGQDGGIGGVSCQNGQAGGNNYLGTGAGAGGTSTSDPGDPGTAGAGGGGGYGNGSCGGSNAGNGGDGTNWDSTHGSGGGGGGGGNENNGGNGGLYGGGGGGQGDGSCAGANAGTGGQGIVVITYTPAGVGSSYDGCSGPTGVAGDVIYNGNYNVMQYCNGDIWVAMGLVGGTPPTNGLVGHWKLDEVSGTNAADSAGTAQDGTWEGEAAIRTATGMIGGAFEFDGVNDLVQIADHNDLDITAAITTAAWINATDTTTAGQHEILNKRADTTPWAAYRFRINNSSSGAKVQFAYSNTTRAGQGVVQGNTPLLAAGQWYHVAATYDTATGIARLYINGVLTEQQFEDTIPMDVNTVALRIGGYANENAYWFSGKIDDVRLYDRALTPEEISQLYYYGLSGGLGDVSANCTSPSEPEGAIIYNTSSNVLQYCNGEWWVGIGK